MDPAAVQALIDAAVTAAELRILRAAPAAAGVSVFSRVPAMATTAVYQDLATATGLKHYKTATEPLSKELYFDFDEDTAQLQLFLDLVRQKSEDMGWGALFQIPVTTPAGTQNYDLLTQYGMIPLASVRDHCMTYYGDPTKQAQDSAMSNKCFMSSVSVAFKQLLTPEWSDYHLPALPGSSDLVRSGPLLLKVITMKAHVDSTATVAHIRDELSKLDARMVTLDSDVQAFNVHVKSQVRMLAARGETSNDLLSNLFKGYKKVDDDEFLDFVKRQYNLWTENDSSAAIDTTSLMAAALMKYKALKLTGEWKAPSKAHDQILALTAKVDVLQAAAGKKSPCAAAAAAAAAAAKSANTGKHKGKWAWKNVIPKKGQPSTKQFEGKTYHINCVHHPNQWVCHSSAECHKASPSGTSNPTPTPTASKAQRLKAAKLAAAAINDEESVDGASDVEADF
jgi:hypothetical protein